MEMLFSYDDFYLPPYAPGAHMMMPSSMRGASSRMNRLAVSARGGSSSYRASAGNCSALLTLVVSSDGCWKIVCCGNGDLPVFSMY